MLPLINAVPGLVWAYRITPETGRAERLPVDCAPAALK
ncbi:MAG: transporter, partial [Rhizobium sp.]|nr:transporter [Rhizobium sp.]